MGVGNRSHAYEVIPCPWLPLGPAGGFHTLLLFLFTRGVTLRLWITTASLRHGVIICAGSTIPPLTLPKAQIERYPPDGIISIGKRVWDIGISCINFRSTTIITHRRFACSILATDRPALTFVLFPLALADWHLPLPIDFYCTAWLLARLSSSRACYLDTTDCFRSARDRGVELICLA